MIDLDPVLMSALALNEKIFANQYEYERTMSRLKTLKPRDFAADDPNLLLIVATLLDGCKVPFDESHWLHQLLLEIPGVSAIDIPSDTVLYLQFCLRFLGDNEKFRSEVFKRFSIPEVTTFCDEELAILKDFNLIHLRQIFLGEQSCSQLKKSANTFSNLSAPQQRFLINFWKMNDIHAMTLANSAAADQTKPDNLCDFDSVSRLLQKISLKGDLEQQSNIANQFYAQRLQGAGFNLSENIAFVQVLWMWYAFADELKSEDFTVIKELKAKIQDMAGDPHCIAALTSINILLQSHYFTYLPKLMNMVKIEGAAKGWSIYLQLNFLASLLNKIAEDCPSNNLERYALFNLAETKNGYLQQLMDCFNSKQHLGSVKFSFGESGAIVFSGPTRPDELPASRRFGRRGAVAVVVYPAGKRQYEQDQQNRKRNKKWQKLGPLKQKDALIAHGSKSAWMEYMKNNPLASCQP